MPRKRRDVIDASEYHQFQTEAELQRAIVNQAKLMHFLVYHTKYSIGSQPGFPDLIIAGHGVVLAVECKGPTGTVSDKQTEWIQKLTEAGIPTWVAFSNRKADYDTIIEFLQTSFQRSVHVSRT